MKCVMIIDRELPIGIIANTSAALGLSLGSQINGLIGPEVLDKSNNCHRGITNTSIPILGSTKEKIKEIHDKFQSENNEEVTIIGFSSLAQKSKCYDDYILKMNDAYGEEIDYLGICIYGPKKVINKVSGSIGILK